jgi:sugar phosphate isomerase/epimerase
MASARLDVLGHGGGEPEAAAAHHLGEADGEELARDEEGAELHHALDGHGVEPVAVVDDVDAGIERHVDGLAVGDVAAHQHAALVGRLNAGRDLLGGHLGLLARCHRAVAARDEHLDDLGALLDLLAHGAAEAVRAVGAVDGAAGADVPVPGEALVAGVPRRADVPAAGHEAGPGEEALGDGGLHGRVDGKGRARADGAGEAAAQQQLEMVRRPHGLQRRRLLEPEGGRLGTELVVGGVEVAAHHARHDGAPVELDHPVLGTGVHGCAGADGGDATILDHHRGAGAGAVRVEDGGVAQDEPRHGRRRFVGWTRSGTVLGHGGNDSDQNPTPAVARPGQAIPPGFGEPMTLGAGDTVLCSGTLRTGITFRERLAAAQAGGFTGLSLWGRDYQVARDEGLSDRDIRLLLADHGLSVAELDPAWWWLPGASDIRIPPELDEERIFGFGERELFAVADAVGARSLNAVDVFGGTWSLDEAAAAFAGLCDRAAEHGLLVHLEFLPWSRIPDLATAWQVVRAADRPNGGLMLDAWHYFRSAPDGALLRSIPGASILGRPAVRRAGDARGEPLHATLHERLLPGDGELGAACTCWPTSGRRARRHRSASRCSPTSSHALPPEEAGRLAGAPYSATNERVQLRLRPATWAISRWIRSLTHWQQILSGPDVLGQTLDDRDDIFALEAEPSRLSQEVLSLSPDDAAFGLARNRDATSSTKLEHAFAS